MEKVALVNCQNYETKNVDTAVKKAFELIAGAEEFIKPGQKVLIKANLLTKVAPEKAVTTHPAVISALVKICMEKGALVTIADSPGGTYTKNSIAKIYKTTGMTDVADETGCALNEDFTFSEIQFEEALVGKKMHIINAALNADIIINAAKMKTHCFTGYTGCVKNLFGLIPGLEKVQMHANNDDVGKFCDFIIDIERFIKDKCVLHFMDAVVGMEGDGPSAGTPKFAGKIIASQCAYSADIVANKIMGAKPLNMPMLKRAAERNIIAEEIKDLEILGENIKDSVVKGYKIVKPNSKKPLGKIVPGFLRKPLFSMLTKKPKIKRNCKGCEKCFEHCPPKAIRMVNNKAVIDYNKCIKCFCCQELCPYLMIKVKKPIIYRLLRFS